MKHKPSLADKDILRSQTRTQMNEVVQQVLDKRRNQPLVYV